MAELVSLSITHAPNKARYVTGDKFERYGMLVRASYSDGTSSQIDDYSFSPASALTPSITRISVSYGGKTTYQNIIVSNPPSSGYFMDKCIDSSELEGNPCVNAADGSLRFRCSPFSVERDSYQLSVSISYNSRMTDRESELIKGMMRGFRTNYHQFLIQDGKDAGNMDLYKYIDGEGYVHTFVYNQGLEAYFDKEGRGLMLDADSMSITDSSNNVLSFDQGGRLISVRSGLNQSDVKRIEYNSDGLRKVYDERNPGTYIRYSYEFSCLRWIKVFYEGELLRTYNLYGFLGQIISIDESAGNETRTLYQFAYNDRNKVNRFVDCLTKEAYRLTYAFDSNINDYRFDSLRKGYMENGTFVQHEGVYFADRRIDNSARVGLIQELVIRDDSDIEMSYMMDSDGALVSAFERDPWNHGSYRPSIRDRGLWIPYQGDCQDYISDSRAFSMPTGAVSIGYGLRPTDLDGERHLRLIGFVKIMARPRRARVSFFASGTSSKDIDIDPAAYGVWQYFELPFERGTDGDGSPIDFASFDFSIYDEEPRSFPAEVANLQWAKGTPEQRLFLSYAGNATCFDDISAVRVYTSHYDYTTVDVPSSPFYMSPGDYLSTMRRYYMNPGAPKAAVLCGGKALMRFDPMIVGMLDDGPIVLFNPSLHADDDIDTGSAVFSAESADSLSRTYYRFREGYYEVISRQDALNESGVMSHYDTVRRYAYNGRPMLETFPDGRSSSFEYFQDGRLMRKTAEYVEGGIRRCVIVYEAVMGADGRRIESVCQDGATIGIEYDGYLEARRTISSPGQQTEFIEKTYNAFCDEVWNTDFKEGGALKERHGYSRPSTSYKTNYLSDGQIGYRVSNSIQARTLSFGIRSGSAYQDVMMRAKAQDRVTETFDNSRPGQTTSHSVSRLFDGYGNLVSELYDGSQMAVFEYGDNHASQFVSQVSRVADSYSGRVAEYGYDGNNELDSIRVGDFFASFSREGDTRTLRESFSGGSETYECVSSVRGCGVTTGSGNAVGFSRWTYQHDALGAVSSKAASPQSAVQRYTYSTDRHHRVVGYAFDSGGFSDVYAESYAYDALGRIACVSVGLGDVMRSVSYRYDALGRIAESERQEGPGADGYLYGDGSSGPLGRMVSFKGTAMSYDARGRLIGFGQNSYGYDEYGNRSSKNGVGYAWERGTLLSSVGLCSFTYDYSGVRSSKRDPQGNLHEYHYADGRLVGEDVSRNGSPIRKLRYFYDLDGLCSLRVIEASGGTKDYAYIRNPFGSIAGLCDGSGVVAFYLYDEWGNHDVLNPDGSVNADPSFIGNINPIRYKGYYYDVETGLYMMGHRYYDPEIGRFISPDDVEYLDPTKINGLNLYAYCNNDPINILRDGSITNDRICWESYGAIRASRIVFAENNSFNHYRNAGIGYPKANSVLMTHHTSSLIENAIFGFLIGNISYTVTTQVNKSEMFYSYSNVGNDGYSVGVGVNIGNWFGTTTYASSNIGFGLSAQITPWFTYGAEVSLTEGLSLSIGGISENITQEVTINIGWGTIAGAYLVSAGIAAMPIPGARILAGAAACIVLLIDVFN